MIFNYKCLNKDNQPVDGAIESVSLDDAIVILQKRGFVVVSLTERTISKNFFDSLFVQKVKEKDLVIFSRQIATLFEAGVGALKAFRLLATENENKTLNQELTEVADDIQAGVSISEALKKHPKLFTPFYVSMVRAGEESGKLNDSFMYLADHLDRSYELNQKIKKAMTYPAFVVGTFVLIMAVMFLFVIPKMTAMFVEQQVTLPLVTRIILGISNFFVNYMIFIFPIFAVLVWFGIHYIATDDGKRVFDLIKIKIPVLKTLFLRIFLARFSDNMHTMLTSGVSIVRSIEITADVVDNVIYKELLMNVSQKVERGVELSKALYEEPMIPNVLVQMVKIGEETGELGYILKNLSNFYKREVDTAVDNVVALIEPAMIVGLGLAVGFLVAAILLPMYDLSSSIS